MPTHFGKYQGKVLNNLDPQGRARLRLSVPAVFGEMLSPWALPCVPYAGHGVGFFAIPPIGANVWVEFMGGELDHPIWSGCFWLSSEEVPATPGLADIKVFKTETATITISDLPGESGIILETASGARIAVSAKGIEMANGSGASILLQGPQVSVNDRTLEVS